MLTTGNDKTSIQLSPDSKALVQENSLIKPPNNTKLTNSFEIFEKSSDAGAEQEKEIAKLDLSLSNLRLDDSKENTTEISLKATEVESLQENVELKQQVQDSTIKEPENQCVEIPVDKGETETTTQITTSASGTEIQEENIKNALKEIINEIDQAVVASESDFEKPKSSVETSTSEPFVPSSVHQCTFSPITTAPGLPFPTFSSSNSFQPQNLDSQHQVSKQKLSIVPSYQSCAVVVDPSNVGLFCFPNSLGVILVKTPLLTVALVGLPQHRHRYRTFLHDHQEL